MRYVREDKKYHFRSAFDTETGLYVRTGILDEKGRDTGIDPFMASFPHLIDVGIMGHCIYGKTGLCAEAGIGCYQGGRTIQQPNMRIEDLEWIVRQCRGRCDQFALGGRGDPDQHEHFEQILKICRENDIVPNFTTSGYRMTPKIASICKKYCGAVAVSWYRSDHTINAIQMLLDAGVRTNIHYVLADHTIDEALARLSQNDLPKGINAVVLLLHKPVGYGNVEDMLSVEDPRVEAIFREVEKRHPFKVGMDSCSVVGAAHFCENIMMGSLDTCEGARYSCYIGADMTMVPCSFDQEKRYGVSLRDHSIEEAWNSERFEKFREHMRNACPACEKRESCMGGCPLIPEIVLCDSEKREIV